MSSIARSLSSLEQGCRGFTVEALAAVLPQAWVDQAIAEHGRQAVRSRLLPPDVTTWLVILLGFFRHYSYVNLLEMIHEAAWWHRPWAGRAPSSSALSRARDRVGVEPLRSLYERSAREWCDQTAGSIFHGRRVEALDGSTFKVADTPENRAHFGAPGASRGRAAYPQLRIVGLRDVGTRLYRATRFGPYDRGEFTLAKDLLEEVKAGTLVLADRNFLAYELLWEIYDVRGADFLVRAKQHVTARVVEQLAPGDAIVEVTLPRALRRKRPDLPRTWILREIRYTPEGGEEEIRLFTTLLLAEEIGADELRDLYPDRWEEEIGYDEIKIHLCGTTTVNRPLALRSQRPERVEQELYGQLTAYNVVRVTMAHAAEKVAGSPRRLSFTAALLRLREAVRDMMQLATSRLRDRYDRLLEATARQTVPRRPERRNPREVKIKMSKYPLKRRPAA